MRIAEIIRNTNETWIKLSLNLDGKGKCECDTGIGFLDHMLNLFTKHGRFDFKLECQGDLRVDFHHTVEDVGIVLGEAVKKALGTKMGIKRYGSMLLPMDEALIQTAVDISGRSYLKYDVSIPSQKVGEFDSELVWEFMYGFVRNADITLHIRQLSGSNSHHIIEGIFKSLARSLKEAVSIDEDYLDEIPSTKGLI